MCYQSNARCVRMTVNMPCVFNLVIFAYLYSKYDRSSMGKHLKAFQHFPSLPVSFRSEMAQRDACLRAQPRLTLAWEFYNKRQQLGKCFSVRLQGNLTLHGRRTKGRDGLRWWTLRWDSVLPYLPILPPRTNGRCSLFSGWCNCFLTGWTRIICAARDVRTFHLNSKLTGIPCDDPHPLFSGALVQVSVTRLGSAGRRAELNWLFPAMMSGGKCLN